MIEGPLGQDQVGPCLFHNNPVLFSSHALYPPLAVYHLVTILSLTLSAIAHASLLIVEPKAVYSSPLSLLNLFGMPGLAINWSFLPWLDRRASAGAVW